jgi:hypothetical protein
MSVKWAGRFPVKAVSSGFWSEQDSRSLAKSEGGGIQMNVLLRAAKRRLRMRFGRWISKVGGRIEKG